MDFHVQPSAVGKATVAVPGDKSISHRSLMLGSIAEGTTVVEGFLAGEDCLATMAAMQAMGVHIQRDGTSVEIRGVGKNGLSAPASALDLGNSGTGMRLMAGLLAAQAFDSELVGDASLSGRPMDRIITPLTSMGAVIESDCDGSPPLQIRGGVRLSAIDYAMPIASAQVKSAVLLAGLYADGTTRVTEPAVNRDHTERMLQTLGAELDIGDRQVSIRGGQTLTGADLQVPADLSSAAFLILAATIAADADVVIPNVGVNPTRTGVLDILGAMGASINLENRRQFGAEPVADIRVVSAKLHGIDVDPALVPLAIDEFPVLFAAAAAAEGVTTFTDIAELRVKESDRIASMSAGLRNLGVRVDETDDGAVVYGGALSGGEVDSCHDHRIAMALAVAGTIASGEVVVRGIDNVETSFPGFGDSLQQLGVAIERSPA